MEIEERTDELEDYIEKENKTISKTIFNFWKNFEELCMAMGEHYASMSFQDIENLTAYKFYSLKSYISKKNKPRKQNAVGTEED